MRDYLAETLAAITALDGANPMSEPGENAPWRPAAIDGFGQPLEEGLVIEARAHNLALE